MLLTSTNSHYLTLSSSGITFNAAPSTLVNISALRSTGSLAATSTASISALTYGGWSFDTLQTSTGAATGSTATSSTFCLMYTPPYVVAGVVTATSTGMSTSTGSIATTASFYLTSSTADPPIYRVAAVATPVPTNVARFTCADCTVNSDGVCGTS